MIWIYCSKVREFVMQLRPGFLFSIFAHLRQFNIFLRLLVFMCDYKHINRLTVASSTYSAAFWCRLPWWTRIHKYANICNDFVCIEHSFNNILIYFLYVWLSCVFHTNHPANRLCPMSFYSNGNHRAINIQQAITLHSIKDNTLCLATN